MNGLWVELTKPSVVSEKSKAIKSIATTVPGPVLVQRRKRCSTRRYGENQGRKQTTEPSTIANFA